MKQLPLLPLCPSIRQTRVGDVPYALIIVLYASMILVGGMGNLLVILVVVRNAAMRTARNVFIVNLAVSDLMLCLITMPLTLVEILYQTWQVRPIADRFSMIRCSISLVRKGGVGEF